MYGVGGFLEIVPQLVASPEGSKSSLPVNFFYQTKVFTAS